MKFVAAFLLGLIYLPIFAGNPDRFQSLDKFVKECMAEYRIPGLAIAVVENDSIVLLKGYGVADPTGRKVTPQTPFFLGSVTKSFTAIAVLRLVETGRLDLDVPIIKYLPWFSMKNGKAKSHSSDRITLRQLLHHTSGIAQSTGQKALPINDDKPDALERQVRSFSSIALAHPPDSCYEYANANYQIAGLVVQVVSGRSIEDVINDEIFKPLKMRHSYTLPKFARADGLATGYRWWFGYPIAFLKQPFPRGCFPSGFCISSVEDLGHYLIAQMNNGYYQGNSILSPKYVSTMHEPGLNNYAMGWNVGQNGEIEHGGHLECFGAHLYIDTKNDRGIALLINVNRGAGCGHVYQIAPTIAKLLAGGSVSVSPVDKGNRNSLFQLLGGFLGISIWVCWSFSRLWKWSKGTKSGFHNLKLKLFLILPFIFECFLIIALVKSIPTYISVAFLHSPEVMRLWLLIICITIGWSLIRTVWVIRLTHFKNSISDNG